MENMSEEMENTPLHETDQLASWMRNEMDSKVSSSNNNCCIYKIPEFIRKEKEQCYSPVVLSIGPIYYGKPELETMEKLKWVTLKWFLEHPNSGDHNLEYYLHFIRQKEEQICECYQDMNKCNLIPKHEFRAMILRDAAFIFYLFIENWTDMEQLAIPDQMRVLMRSQTDRDLFLLENQMPYFILESLYDVSFGMILQVSFIELTRYYIGSRGRWTLPGCKTVNSQVAVDEIAEETCIDHLLDFLCRCLQLQTLEQRQRRLLKPKKNNNKVTETIKKAAHYVSTTLIPLNRRPSVQNQQIFPSSAKQLSDAGIQFKASKSINQLDIGYADGVLEIPKIDLDDNTESAIRNIIYFEQCRYYNDSCFIDYVYFLDGLINTEEDIQILVENKILDSLLGSHREAADLFNKVTTNTTINSYNFSYADISVEMNGYANTSWHRWKAILKRDYFNHPWSVISVTYLVILLVLTILQVYTGFKAS
ncbi:UPF0481 protein At3g47200-like [Amaranthus tricolor]|uniref:UPF0481 protein At3g47200-like n=1 Tax=Amaranthus tricolor TaxID=29722 RepID=UPI0025902B26|nr:UPF0481 protein At3g47200-like [Amaranthus tricolor]XP_057533514.1 UPF0481 protein At3g47200-like [Amaranthus tricolor]XP_057533515.1 UPF0481 protein At3g47200-like [Amaranthus tricolor]XP_057533516.1 UPF0481 protein At3g47200-like [Amaranthus tricolor]